MKIDKIQFSTFITAAGVIEGTSQIFKYSQSEDLSGFNNASIYCMYFIDQWNFDL